MPHEIQFRTVSDFKILHPRTWGKYHREYRVVWDMYTPLREDELSDFAKDNGNKYGVCEWKRMRVSV